MKDLHQTQPSPRAMTPLSARLHRNTTHRRYPSDELDVFEASRYLSGYSDTVNLTNYPPKERQKPPNSPPLQPKIPTTTLVQQRSHANIDMLLTITPPSTTKKPTTTGRRLTRFLTSLFHHQSSFRKESKTKSVKSDEEDETSGDKNRRWRRRRSSTGHFHSRASVSSEPGGVLSVRDPSKVRGGPCGNGPCLQHEGLWERGKRVHVREMLEKGVVLCDDDVEKRWTLNGDSVGMVVIEDEVVVPKGRRGHLWRREEVEGGGDSDSSGELFELPVFDTTGAPAKLKL